jgi:hypothetical protein
MNQALIAMFILTAAGLIVFAIISAKRRREALAALAQELKLDFDPYSDAHTHFDGFWPFGIGSGRRSANELSGQREGREWTIFDYRYTTGSGKNRSTHRVGVIACDLPISLPPLTIRAEGLFDKIAGLAGFDDINFESEAFSRRYHVKCDDRKAAYDLIHPQMIEFLLSIQPMHWQIRGRTLLLARRGTYPPDQIRPLMQIMTRFIALTPAYLRAHEH